MEWSGAQGVCVPGLVCPAIRIQGACLGLLYQPSHYHPTTHITHSLFPSPASLTPFARYFDFEKLHEVTTVVTRNLNKIIDVNYYPVASAERSNKRHRPIGLGVQVGSGARRGGTGGGAGGLQQPSTAPAACVCLWWRAENRRAGSVAAGLGGAQWLHFPVCWPAPPCCWACSTDAHATPPNPPAHHHALKHLPSQGLADAFLLLGMPFDSPEAAELNRAIFETIYHAAVQVCVCVRVGSACL